MAEMRGALSSLQGVLNRPDGTPTANIEASPLPVQDWLDVNAKYPAELIVRLEAQRGLSHMGGSSINDMKGALANVERVSKEHSAQWRSALNQQPRGLVLPSRVLRARSLASVYVQLADGVYEFHVPTWLGRSYLKRDVSTWDAIAAHVITEPGMQYEVLKQHRIFIPAAIEISGQGPFQITEREAFKDKKIVTSQLSPADVCDSLRGELRFVRADEPTPVRAAFRVAPERGGAR